MLGWECDNLWQVLLRLQRPGITKQHVRKLVIARAPDYVYEWHWPYVDMCSLVRILDLMPSVREVHIDGGILIPCIIHRTIEDLDPYGPEEDNHVCSDFCVDTVDTLAIEAIARDGYGDPLQIIDMFPTLKCLGLGEIV
ncbi:hypothetical protein NM688_g1861 [Phlebia brevispora]|uniref:Uncharacterized protein n=1 Tax=Phlebia brevispora TaxID=194682 RepID=A0ACC1TAH9_9APHY|nr:hypothetical protein NM688_g1861 [Phlebia brevispora]